MVKKLSREQAIKLDGDIQRLVTNDKVCSCKTCYGYGMWAWGDTTQPMGSLDAKDGVVTLPCPECGACANPTKVNKKE